MGKWQEWKDNAVLGAFIALFGAIWAVANSKWIIAIALIIGPPFYLAFRPSEFTPFVDTVFSVALSAFVYWVGRSEEMESIRKHARTQASDRWMPQAESVVFRLLTLHSNIRRLGDHTRDNCDTAECELPELKSEELRAVRVKMQTECDATAARLDDIAHQVEDAIGDWHRFIRANCGAFDCERIFEAIESRKAYLGLSVDGKLEYRHTHGQANGDDRETAGDHITR